MTVTRLSSKRIKITLDKDESSLLFNHTSLPRFSDPHTIKSLRYILRKATHKTDFLENSCRLYVEIYPLSPSGVIIFFTKPDEARSTLKQQGLCTYIITAKNLESTFKLCRLSLCDQSKIVASKLLKYNGAYHIILQTALLKKIPQIKEFADNICTSKLTAAKISEYGKTIISDNAIDSLAKLSQDF